MNSIVVSSLIGLLAGTAGAMGLGGGTVLMIYLTVFADTPQLAAQGINLVFFLPTAAVATFMSAKQHILQKEIIVRYIFWGAVGVLLGNMLACVISTQLLGKLFGGLLLIIGIRELLWKNTDTCRFAQKSGR